MKARSYVFTALQWPETLLGCPRLIMMGVMALAMLGFVFLAAIGYAQFSVLFMIGVMAVGVVLALRQSRKDPHIESVFLESGRFWRTARRCWRIAGAPPPSKGSKKRRPSASATP